MTFRTASGKHRLRATQPFRSVRGVSAACIVATLLAAISIPAIADEAPAPDPGAAATIPDVAAPSEADPAAPSAEKSAEAAPEADKVAEDPAEPATAVPEDPATAPESAQTPEPTVTPDSIEVSEPAAAPESTGTPESTVTPESVEVPEPAATPQTGGTSEPAETPGSAETAPPAETPAAPEAEQPSAPAADQPTEPAPAPRQVAVDVQVTPATGGFGTVTFTATIDGSVAGTGSDDPTGDVDFTSAPDVGTCADAAIDAGTVGDDIATATCALDIDPGQSVTVTAAYAGDGDYDADTDSVTYQAAKKPTTVTVSTTATGESGLVTFRAQMTSSVEAMTGTVDFTTNPDVGGCTAVPVSGGPPSATCDITINPGQEVDVTAEFSNDPVYSDDTDTLNYVALLVPTVTVAPTGTGPAGTITFTAEVQGSGALPTGVVDFTSTGTGSCTGVALTGTPNPTATCQLPVAIDEEVTVTADYSGDAAYEAATGDTTYTGLLTPTVGITPTGMGAPGPVTFTAEVQGSGALPTGVVDFTVMGPPAAVTTEGAEGCTAAPLSGGTSATATCVIVVDPGEMVQVEAEYKGDATYHSATTNTMYQARFVASVTVMSPDADENGQGDPGTVDFIATVTGSGVGTVPRPMGTVTMTASEGDDSLCASLMVPSTGPATVTCPVSGIPSNAAVTITATYTASVSNFESGATGSTVYKTPTKQVSVAISAPPNSGAGLVPFTATVTSNDGSTPTGSVEISLQTTGTLGVNALAPSTCTAPLTPGPGAGQATGTCSLNVPAGANVTVTAAYNGTATYLANSSQISFQGKRTPAVSLAVTPTSPADAGDSVTLTATVGADSSGIAPTGTVRFDVGGTAISGCEAVAVSAGKATCTTAALPTGSLTLNATYSGDAEYLAGSAQAAGYQVNAAVSAAATLPVTGANVGDLLLGALLLLLVGGGAVAFGHTAPGRRGTR